MRARTTSQVVLAVGLTLFLAAGCRGTVTPTPVLATENFTGSLAVQGADTKSFTVNFDQAFTPASVIVTALTTVANSTPVGTTIGVAFGSLTTGGECIRSIYTSNAIAINQELLTDAVFGPGLFCVQIFDAGTLTEPVNYALTVKHY